MNARTHGRAGGRLLVGLFVLFSAWLFAASAQAQGFMVKPMRMDVVASPGRTIEVPLEIRNTAGADVRAVDLRLAQISQSPDGSWRLIEPGAPDDVPTDISALPFISLASPRADIEPLQPVEMMIRVTPPPDARGVYFAAIIAETPAPEQTEGGIVVRVRFVVPVIIEIEGRTARQQVSLSDVLMTYDKAADGKPATTTAALQVVNAGRTFSRVKGKLTIEKKNAERWQPVTRFDLRERAIMPGLTFALGQDLERRLPSGTYRLRGELNVDGRRIPPVIKEIAFEGASDADGLAFDTALVLTPSLVEMAILPGATRTTSLRIENPGVDPVTVDMASTTPPQLGGVAMGELLGVELSAEPWVEITPPRFTIRPGSRQNVRVTSRVPKDALKHPNYYGDLVLKGTYADGQSAGATQSTVHLSYDAIKSTTDGIVEQISLAQGEKPNQYFVQMRLTNIGDVHVLPSASVSLVSSLGSELRKVALDGDEGPLLPLGKRTFSAEINLEGVEPGFYALRAISVLSAEKSVTGQQVIQVASEEVTATDGTKSTEQTVSIVDPSTTELPEGLRPASPDEDAGKAANTDKKS
jgi:hypothetical protein